MPDDDIVSQLTAIVGQNQFLTGRQFAAEERRMEIRIRMIELGLQIAVAKGKPAHAPYIAADLYAFVLTGQKPEPPRARERED